MLPDAPICQMSPGRHFPTWNQKCFKTVLWKPPGVTFRAGARNASKKSSGSLLESVFRVGSRIALTQTSGSLLGSPSGLGPEMLQNRSLAPGLTFRAGPACLVSRTLYVLHHSRAFHEVWCPQEIGRDSWVREATGVTV